MKNSEIVEISNKMSSDIKFSTDAVRLLAPKLLNYTENKRDFLILFELSKFQAIRNQIVSIIKKDLNIREKLKSLIKRKKNKSIVKKIRDLEVRIND